jgi:UDP-N-acetylglucosamine diphosphorylase / glucose-1-phosphate thymidylyltransferase / UDP-N-acetylgalactosamine diphosphorylase / glucosamine-1-phosphate N-acetyltransferase / galactosamine-1-phosphate N-acetyltransferase
VLAPRDFFELSQFAHAAIFEDVELVWQALPKLLDYLQQAFGLSGETAPEELRHLVGISSEAVVESGAELIGPVLVGPGCHLAANSVLRGPVLLGKDVYVGRYSEVKASIVLDEAKVPHLSYVGDSIIGADVNMGAGAVLSNLKLDWGPITVHVQGRDFATGMQKLGAILGDHVQIGCNAVLHPGTVIGANTWVYPCASLRGYYPPDSIVKVRQSVELIEKKR